MENDNSVTVTIQDADAMRALGRRLGKLLFPGAFIALFGGLGAGKTTLTTGVADALDIHDISSPTFTIVKRHPGDLLLDHFDAYRIEDEDELCAMGYEDHLESESVIVMEWCENVPAALPGDRLEVHIEGSGNDDRTVCARAFGDGYVKLLEAFSLC